MSISIRASRNRPTRKPTESDKTPEGGVKSFPAPVEGLQTATPRSTGSGAVVLENFWPTPTGIEPRGGLELVGTAGSRIQRIFEHVASGTRFVATNTDIRPWTDAGIGAATVTGLTSGNWSTYEVQNSGGSFLVAVNGADTARTFNGTTWAASTITGVGTDTLSFVWGHRSRLFFVQRGSLSAWYLGTNSIGGAATELPLAATFTRGGSLMAGATWSSDSGAGMDDRCAFITDQGEVAIFSGSNPGDINNWSLDGVYYVGKILGDRAIERIGGDLIFATTAGLIPLTGAVQKAPEEFASVSLARSIGSSWRDLTARRPSDWRLALWDQGRALFACPIGSEDHFVANLDTPAWATITGWHMSDLRQIGQRVYMADMTGGLYRAWTSGRDHDSPIVCRMALAHDHLGDASTYKRAHLVRPVWRHIGQFTDGVSVGADYEPRFPNPPQETGGIASATSLWDVAAWDASLWGSGVPEYQTDARWRTVSGAGQALGVQVQVVMNSANRVPMQLQRVDLQFTTGSIDL